LLIREFECDYYYYGNNVNLKKEVKVN
jgi:hypothetical protein